MKPPSAIVVGPYTYSVVVDEAEVHRGSYELKGQLIGHADHLRQVIALMPELGPDVEAEVLAHEVLHCVCRQIGVELDDEEAVVGAIAFSLVDVLRRNPELVSFLTQAPADPTRAAGRSRHGRSTNGRQRAAAEEP